MTIHVTCPDCGTTVAVDEKHAGRQGRCKKCGAMIEVPALPVTRPAEFSPTLTATPQSETPSSSRSRSSLSQLYFVVGGIALMCLFVAFASIGRKTEVPAISAATSDSEIVESRLAAVESQFELLKRTEELWSDSVRRRLELLESDSRPAAVSTTDDSYDIAKTKFGPFIVSSGGATQYLDGFKVKLKIGNLTNAMFQGAKLTVWWGQPDGDNPLESGQQIKRKEIRLTEDLLPGQSTFTDVTLTPAEPDEIKTVFVWIELGRIGLRP